MKTKQKAAKRTKGKILIVEDDPNAMKLLSTLLRASGYQVFKAEYSLPALFRVVHNKPDLILADLKMPMMNGVDLIHQLKAHADTCDLPVVVVTGCDDEKTRNEAFAAGCSAYLTKPIDIRALTEQLDNILNTV